MAKLTHLGDGKAAVHKREGTYCARIRVDGKYVRRTLKTGDLAAAIKATQKLVHQFEFSAEHGIPVSAKQFSVAIDEYVGFRHHFSGTTADVLTAKSATSRLSCCTRIVTASRISVSTSGTSRKSVRSCAACWSATLSISVDVCTSLVNHWRRAASLGTR